MPRRQDRQRRLSLALFGRDRGERLRQKGRVLLHRLHALGLKQLWKHPHHDLAVLQHIADTRWRAAVVFKDEEVVRPRAHQIDAHDMAVDPARRPESDHRLLVSRVLIDQTRRNAPRADDLAPVVDVEQKRIQRPRPLLDPALELAPLPGREDAREHVEGDQPVGIAALAIDREGDADPAEQRLGLRLAQAAQIVGHLGGPGIKPRIRRPRATIRHLVEETHTLALILTLHGAQP